MKAYIAEFIGTFALSLIVILSVSGSFPIPTPILAAMTLGLFVYTIGHISGAHLNPAVTLALWFNGKIDQSKVVGYILAQMGAAIAASEVAMQLHLQTAVNITDTTTIAMAEGLGMFIFGFGIAAVVSGKINSLLSGIIVGSSLFLGIAIASMAGSNGILNPVVALSLHSMYNAYMFGPILGAILGMWVYAYLHETKPLKVTSKKSR